MTLRIPTNASSQIPFRGWIPDISIKNPNLGVKGGIYGAFQQPAEYLGRYAYDNYGGAEKTRAFGLKAQWEIQKVYRDNLGRFIKYWSPYHGYAKIPKDAKTFKKNASTNRKFQTSTFQYNKLRRSKCQCSSKYRRWNAGKYSCNCNNNSSRGQTVFPRYRSKFYKRKFFRRY